MCQLELVPLHTNAVPQSVQELAGLEEQDRYRRERVPSATTESTVTGLQPKFVARPKHFAAHRVGQRMNNSTTPGNRTHKYSVENR